MQRALFLLLLIHGGIHWFGFARAFSSAPIAGLTETISRPLGVLWLAAGLLMVASAFAPARAFWIVGVIALVASQWAIGTSWPDAKYGTLPNLVLLIAVAYSFASAGPFSFAAEYQRDVTTALARVPRPTLLEETDLSELPAPVQRYLRFTGAIGKPRIANLRARWRGRLRGAASDAWMTIRAEQVETLAPTSERFFHLRATMRGLPVDVYHRFVGDEATFRVRALSSIPMVTAAGPEMRRAETVTILNDICLLAPAALVEPAFRWSAIDEHRVSVAYTRGVETVQAELHFDDAGQLINFVSDDRHRASPDAKTFLRQRWSTPSGDYRKFGDRRISAHAVARWHAPEGTFDYADFELESVEYNLPAAPALLRILVL